jgi:hypothetical protein
VRKALSYSGRFVPSSRNDRAVPPAQAASGKGAGVSPAGFEQNGRRAKGLRRMWPGDRVSLVSPKPMAGLFSSGPCHTRHSCWIRRRGRRVGFRPVQEQLGDLRIYWSRKDHILSRLACWCGGGAVNQKPTIGRVTLRDD